MSYSSLYVIGKDLTGTEEHSYKNAWLFPPIVWDTLTDKYATPDPNLAKWGIKKSIISSNGAKVAAEVNEAVNNCNCIEDRICWELASQQIFQTKDKELVADCIYRFLKTNENYPRMKEDHIVERFCNIASHIRLLDEETQPYFVFKDTSVDDNVKRWFLQYSEELDEYLDAKISDLKEYVSEVVVIENGEIVDFVPNNKWNWE